MEKVRQVDIQMRYTRMGHVFMMEIEKKESKNLKV